MASCMYIVSRSYIALNVYNGWSFRLSYLGCIALRHNISPFTSDLVFSINSTCIESIKGWDSWSCLFNSVAISPRGVLNSNPSWGTLCGIGSFCSFPSISEPLCPDFCCGSPYYLPQLCIHGSGFFRLDSQRFILLLLLSFWGFLRLLLWIGVWFVLSGMPTLGAMNPAFSFHCGDIYSCPNVCNYVSKFARNCGLTSPVFNDITITTFL